MFPTQYNWFAKTDTSSAPCITEFNVCAFKLCSIYVALGYNESMSMILFNLVLIDKHS